MKKVCIIVLFAILIILTIILSYKAIYNLKKTALKRRINYKTIIGISLSKISKIMKNRTGKQIRDRYINVLDPLANKNKFTSEEDRILLSLYRQYGCKWATIAKFMNRRTPDMVKNRFHSCLKKKLEDESINLNFGEVNYLFFYFI